MNDSADRANPEPRRDPETPDDPGSLKVFINYRRADSAGHAGRLYDALVRELGEDSVFMDIDKIELGIDYTEAIDNAVGSCDVLLAVMGREWLTISGEDGSPRLQNPTDYVRLELESAMRRSDVRIIPLLIEGATMPGPELLPESLSRLSRFQAQELSDTRFHYDVRRLVGALRRLAETEEQARRAAQQRESQEAEEERRREAELEQERERAAREEETERRRAEAAAAEVLTEEAEEAAREREEERAAREKAAIPVAAPGEPARSEPADAVERKSGGEARSLEPGLPPWKLRPVALLAIGVVAVVLVAAGLAVAGVFGGGEGNGSGGGGATAADAVPSGDVAIVDKAAVGSGEVSEAAFERALAQQVTEAKLKQAPPPGSKKYHELEVTALGELLDAIWIQGEAEERNIAVTSEQIERKKAQVKKENFPTESEYQEFLSTNHFTDAEVDARIEIQLLSQALLQEIKREAPASESKKAVQTFVREYNQRWRSRTVCAKGYVINKCSNS